MRIAMIGVKGIPYTAGIDRYTEEVGSRLVKRGHKLLVFVRPHYMKNSNRYYEGMKLISLPSIYTKHLDAISHIALSTLYSLGMKLDIVHFHMIGSSLFSLFPRIKGVKTVVQIHGLDYERAKWGYFARIYLKASDYSSIYFPDRTLVISKNLKKLYEEKFGREVYYIPPGVELGQLAEPKRILKLGLKKYILFVGRLVPEKGCHYLIKAFREIDTEMKLIIVGGTSHTDEYVDSLKRWQNGRIRFLGFISEELLRELFSNACLFVQPSEVEGLPHTILQALSFGRCVLASDIPGNLEALGECGYTFKSKDYEDLRGKMKYLIEHPAAVREQFQKARNHVRKDYDWERVVDKLEEVYLSLLKKEK